MNSTLKQQSKFSECIIEMVVSCHPEGYFKEKPNLKQCWKWLKKIMEEYMALKKTDRPQAELKEVETGSREWVKHICDYLHVQSKKEVLSKLSDLCVD